MKCPRCGEDNLPGLPACFGCGLDLSRPRELPDRLVPRVRAANPLDRRPPPPPAARTRRVRLDAQLAALGPHVAATLWGVVPGLGALARGDRRLAGRLVGGLLLCAAAWGLLWTSVLQPFAVMGALSVVGTSILSEQRARLGLHGIGGQAPGVLLAAATCLALWAGGSLAAELAFPRVRLGEALRLPSGHYLVRPVALAEVTPGTLVALGDISPRLLPWGEGVAVAPVIALPGQRVEADGDGTVLVDGAPPVVPALNPGVPAELVVEAVPPGHVVLLRMDLTPVPWEEVGGALWYRWLPRAVRGPVPWPPEEVAAPSARIEVLRE